jgi:hypothetical protein
LGRAGKLCQTEAVHADAEETPRAVADGLHGAGDVALAQPEAEAAKVAVARPTEKKRKEHTS